MYIALLTIAAVPTPAMGTVGILWVVVLLCRAPLVDEGRIVVKQAAS
jgi:hypothetical protein